MSISLVLIPVALALRAVMGKKRFEDWVASMQVKIPTKFSDEDDLVLTVRKAGYDAEKFGGSIKTHVRGEEFFFFWDKIDGVWAAVFAKSDPKGEISDFLRDLEKKAGRRLFDRDEERGKIEVMPTKTYPTNFRDPDLLTQTLSEFGLTPSLATDGAVTCRAQGSTLVFRRDGDGVFHVEVWNPPDPRKIMQHLSDMDECYGRAVQARAYEKLKDRIAVRGLIVEEEQVLEDDSIVLTLVINRQE